MVGADEIYRPDREMFQRAEDDAFDTLSKRSFVNDDFLMDTIRDIVSYDGVDNWQKSLTEASSVFFGRLDDMMAQVPQWYGPAVWRMFLDYDMTDVHDFLAPCTFIKSEAYAHMVSTWDELHEHALDIYVRAKEHVHTKYKMEGGR